MAEPEGQQPRTSRAVVSQEFRETPKRVMTVPQFDFGKRPQDQLVWIRKGLGLGEWGPVDDATERS